MADESSGVAASGGGGGAGGPLGMLTSNAGVLLLAGLLLVVLSRGCGVIDTRQVSRLQAKASLEESDFKDKYNRLELEIESKDQSDDAKREEFEKLRDKKKEEKKELQESLFEMNIDARDASAKRAAWAYWYEWLFLIGTLLLVMGLVGMALGEAGPSRWVALVVLGVIVFSIYVGGMAWVSTAALPFG